MAAWESGSRQAESVVIVGMAHQPCDLLARVAAAAQERGALRAFARVARRLRAAKPGLRVVFSSGYSAEIAGRELKLADGENFLQKPFTSDALLEMVRRAIDGRASPTRHVHQGLEGTGVAAHPGGQHLGDGGDGVTPGRVALRRPCVLGRQWRWPNSLPLACR